MKRLSLFIIFSGIFLGMAYGQKKFPYKDASLSIDQRLDSWEQCCAF